MEQELREGDPLPAPDFAAIVASGLAHASPGHSRDSEQEYKIKYAEVFRLAHEGKVGANYAFSVKDPEGGESPYLVADLLTQASVEVFGSQRLSAASIDYRWGEKSRRDKAIPHGILLRYMVIAKESEVDLSLLFGLPSVQFVIVAPMQLCADGRYVPLAATVLGKASVSLVHGLLIKVASEMSSDLLAAVESGAVTNFVPSPQASLDFARRWVPVLSGEAINQDVALQERFGRELMDLPDLEFMDAILQFLPFAYDKAWLVSAEGGPVGLAVCSRADRIKKANTNNVAKSFWSSPKPLPTPYDPKITFMLNHSTKSEPLPFRVHL